MHKHKGKFGFVKAADEGKETGIQGSYPWNITRRAVIVAPIFILMISLGMINWLLPDSEVEATIQTTPGSLTSAMTPSGAENSGAAVASPPLLGLATPWGILGRGSDSLKPSEPTPMASSLASTGLASLPGNIPSDAVIDLLGPPEESRFQLNGDISFYWDWPLPLEANQRFAVYLREGGDEWLLGAVDQSNMGSSFRLRANPAEFVAEPERYEWLVRLERMPGTAGNGAQADVELLIESEARLLSLTGED
jgi:hypothetical protein